MTLLLPCSTCESLGRPDGVPPHSARQHVAMWADTADIGTRAPAWELVLSDPLPEGWKAPPRHVSRNVDNFVAALPAGIHVLWSRLPRPS